ncbi:uncharacterized protein BDR25DRAFT_383788 [Lindgomyces ingoldianus]|uniref:Uncharacterized protein n=1 Tax=Lindgomyces ingoldianus TaxID=673940 RepID=A0ACB6R7H8_9PLEO|nr:uncharacterized protein BDR25DRAFT_383788 [Lindgomyces ingoldianus]KAF2474477.1 hypothetical protein BDR25DRAFT_383788 [Lindgomyces ingoldianus]
MPRVKELNRIRSSPPIMMDSADAPSSPASSEPAVFSSDGPMESAGIDNYQAPRMKRKFGGAWWDKRDGSAHHNDSGRDATSKKTKLKRNIDSGVWMHSDDTDNDAIAYSLPIAPNPPSEEHDYESDKYDSSQSLENFVHDMVDDGLACHSESYDLTDLGLVDKDLSPLGGLSALIKPPLDPGSRVPGKEYYRSMLPQILLNLSKNSLSRLTPSLFTIEHLTTLMLPNNDIKELPPQIGRLTNLTLLDVCNNRLRSLPYDIIKMLTPRGKLERLSLMGNDLFEMASLHRIITLDSESLLHTTTFERRKAYLDSYRTGLLEGDSAAAVCLTKYLEEVEKVCDPDQVSLYSKISIAGTKETQTPLFHIGNTAPTYYDDAGRRLRGSPRQPTGDGCTADVIVKMKDGTWGSPSSWFSRPGMLVPSLFSLCGKTALEHLSTLETRAMMARSGVELFNLDRFLDIADDNHELVFGPFRNCHQCGKKYVVARAEWLEFWYRPVNFVPFRVEVCSWACVPDEVALE